MNSAEQAVFNGTRFSHKECQTDIKAIGKEIEVTHLNSGNNKKYYLIDLVHTQET